MPKETSNYDVCKWAIDCSYIWSYNCVSANSLKKRSKMNWKKVDSLPDSKIDHSDVPELDARFFREAIRWPGTKHQITLRLDPDILEFFRRHGKGYQTTINAVLRRYMEAQQERGAGRSR